MSIIFPDLYLRTSDGTKQSYDNIADLETKLADGEATYPWQKIEEIEKAWKLTIDPNIFEEHADGTKEVSAEILKLLFSTIKVSNTILNRLQKKAGKKWGIGIAFTAVSHSLNRSYGSFVEDGFESGDIIQITGSALNDGIYTVDTVYETQMKVIEDVVDEFEIPCIVTIGGKIDVILYDKNISQFIPAIWNVPLDIEVVEEGEEFSRIKMNSEPRQRYSLDRFTNAGDGLFESGAGTEADPYIITNVWQLQWMNEDKNAWYELGCDINASPTRDWNGGKGFVPIGKLAYGFNGHFNGTGHIITGLYINRPSEDYIGLFACCDTDGRINNVGLENANITGRDTVGILVGYAQGHIEKVYSTGIVEKHPDSNTVGGLIGAAYEGFMITDCYSTAQINSVEQTGESIGGLIGVFAYGTATNCYSTGEVNKGVAGDGIGGFAGNFCEIDTTFTNCFWDKETSGQEHSAGEGEGVTGKTTAQMKQETTFTNWDFDTIWDIIEDTTYPWLKVFI